MTADKLPRHKFWGTGEPDCPRDIKAPNGELRTMRCKVCGDGWRKSGNVCLAAVAAPDAREARPARLAQELRGVIVDVEQGGGFDAVCLATIKRVAAALVHPAAPLSEPCAPDQGARPVRPLSDLDVLVLFNRHRPLDDGTEALEFARAIERALGIAPPVDQQEGSTQ